MKISDIKIDSRARRDVCDIKSLAESIQRVRLLHPVVVDPQGNLIAGFRRIEALKFLGRDDIPATVVDNLNSMLLKLQPERDGNRARKGLSRMEAVEFATPQTARTGTSVESGSSSRPGIQPLGTRASVVSRETSIARGSARASGAVDRTASDYVGNRAGHREDAEAHPAHVTHTLSQAEQHHKE
jgi:hypothetical protein